MNILQPQTAAEQHRMKVILLVEDDIFTGLACRKLLEKNDYRVLSALNGEQAVETAAIAEIDLIVMDIELGGVMDGITAAEEILKFKNIPVLFLTAHLEKETLDRVRSVTRYGYALKNTGEYVLLSSIEMVFDLFHAHKKTRESEENYKSLVEDINDVIFSINEKGIFTYISPRIMHFTDYRPDEIIGRSLNEFISNEDVPRVREQFEIITAGGSFFEEYKWVKKNGGIVWFRFSSSPVFINGEFRGFKGLLIDITFRKRSEQEMEVLLKEKEKLLRELNCLYRISRLMEENAGLLDHLLARIVLLIPEGFDNAGCAFASISFSGKEYVSSHNFIPDSFIEKEFTIRGSYHGKVTVGYTHNLQECDEQMFDEKDREFFNTVTERVGRIIELSLARDELRKLEREVIDISERERQKIGHELHDSLGQLLTGVSFMLKNVSNQLNGSTQQVSDRINEISGLIQEATLVCRQITRGLPLVTVQHNTLLVALDQLAINTRDMFGINCEVKSFGLADIGDDFVSSQLYRITQEAVNNAVKHSGAKNIYITFSGSPVMRLSIRDDGCGSNMDKGDRGMGLSIMKYRADLISGEFSAASGVNGGFEVSVTVQ